MDGPNANVVVEITVTDFPDKAHVVSIAQHTLHVAMIMQRRVTSSCPLAPPGGLPKRGAERKL